MILFAFCIHLGGAELDTNRLRCIDSIRCFYPELVIVTEWGDCPYPQDADPRWASDILRRWILSQHEEALYFDTDVELLQRLVFDKTDKIWLGEQDGCHDEWLLYHKGRPEDFAKLLCVPIVPPHYTIKGGENFIHHGYTTNNLQGVTMAEEQKTISEMEYIHNVKDGIDAAFVNLKQIISTLVAVNKKQAEEIATLKASKAKK